MTAALDGVRACIGLGDNLGSWKVYVQDLL